MYYMANIKSTSGSVAFTSSEAHPSISDQEFHYSLRQSPVHLQVEAILLSCDGHEWYGWRAPWNLLESADEECCLKLKPVYISALIQILKIFGRVFQFWLKPFLPNLIAPTTYSAIKSLTEIYLDLTFQSPKEYGAILSTWWDPIFARIGKALLFSRPGQKPIWF